MTILSSVTASGRILPVSYTHLLVVASHRSSAASGHLVSVYDYESLEDFFLRRPEAAEDLWLATTKAPQYYCQARFREGCWLFFCKETAGLP